MALMSGQADWQTLRHAATLGCLKDTSPEEDAKEHCEAQESTRLLSKTLNTKRRVQLHNQHEDAPSWLNKTQGRSQEENTGRQLYNKAPPSRLQGAINVNLNGQGNAAASSSARQINRAARPSNVQASTQGTLSSKTISTFDTKNNPPMQA